MIDNVNHPEHYTSHPSGIECIRVTEHMGFCLGNAIKYIWRADLKDDAEEDLRKAIWYLEREIWRRRSLAQRESPGEKVPLKSPGDEADLNGGRQARQLGERQP